MSWLVFDCASGVSGDMTLGALVDLGVPLEHLRESLVTLPLEGWALRQERVLRHTIAATQVHVDIDAQHPSSRHHRHLHDIVEILTAGRLSERTLGWALEVFRRLALAEAAVHGVPVGQVHFHEVGAVDAIVDIAGACVGIDWLCRERGVRGVRVSQLRVGRGQVRSEHGVMPVPPPATLRLLEGIPIQWSEGDGERATPTGAAILSTFARPLGGATVRVRATGYGAGTSQFPDTPNVLRLLLCEPDPETDAGELPLGADLARVRAEAREGGHVHEHSRGEGPSHVHEHSHDAEPARAQASSQGASPHVQHGRVAVLRTTIDDMVPEFFGHLMTRLFASGALDVFYTPVFMKKDRPATLVTVIARPGEAQALVEALLNESSTLGVRIAYEERAELPRRVTTVATAFGKIQVKVARRPDGKLRAVPEYESVRRAAEAAGVPIADVYRAALCAEVDQDAAPPGDAHPEASR
jgi:hypothetical protein